MRRLWPLLVVVLSCSGEKAAAPPVEQAKGRSSPAAAVVAAPAACACPQLPTYATSEKPAPGKVSGELSSGDLEAAFSNRRVIFAFYPTWIQALAHDIDPDGRLRVARGAKPDPGERLRDIGLKDGSISTLLVTGKEPAWSNRRSGESSLKSVVTPEFLTTALVATIARTKKYGEPEAHLRQDSLLIARFWPTICRACRTAPIRARSALRRTRSAGGRRSSACCSRRR